MDCCVQPQLEWFNYSFRSRKLKYEISTGAARPHRLAGSFITQTAPALWTINRIYFATFEPENFPTLYMWALREKSTSRARFLSASQTEQQNQPAAAALRVMDGVWAVLLCVRLLAGGCWRTHWERQRISRVYCTSESRHPLNETWQPASTPCAREALKHTERARSPFLIKLIRIQLNGGLILLQRLSRMHSESELSEWTRERGDLCALGWT